MLFQLSLESSINCLFLDPLEDIVYLGSKNKNIYVQTLSQSAQVFSLGISVSEEKSSKQPGQEPKIHLQKQKLNKKVFSGHKEEVILLNYFRDEELLISGAADGQILFWNIEGSIVRSLNILTSCISNLYIFRRTKEFEKEDTPFGKKKKLIEFKAFKKYENEEVKGANSSLLAFSFDQSARSGEDRNLCVKRNPQYLDYYYLTHKSVKSEIASTNEATRQRDLDRKYEDLLQENAKLREMNNKLFNACFNQHKI